MKNILIVDDSDIVRMSFKKILKTYDNIEKIYGAIDVDAAIETIDNELIDIIMIDVLLRGESGFDILKYINDKSLAITTIIMSNYPKNRFQELSEDYNADFFFSKSQETDAIVEKIKELIE